MAEFSLASLWAVSCKCLGQYVAEDLIISKKELDKGPFKLIKQVK